MGLTHTLIDPINPDHVAHIRDGEAHSKFQAMADRLNRLVQIQGLYFSHVNDGHVAKNLAILTGYTHHTKGKIDKVKEPPPEIGWPIY